MAATARKLPSGNWRTQAYIGKDSTGKRQYESFTAETKGEAEFLAAEFAFRKKEIAKNQANMTLEEAIDTYIGGRDAVLSPTTVEGYQKIKRNHFPDLLPMQLKKIDKQVLEDAVNQECKRKPKRGKKDRLDPKTVENAYTLIVSVINKYAPGIDTKIKLPDQINKIKELIPPGTILDVIRGTDIELAVLLSMWLSFSKSEIRGLTKSNSLSPDGCYLTVREVIVDVNGKPVKKSSAKEYYRIRRHKIPQYIKLLIENTDPNEDYLVPMSGQSLYRKWVKLLRDNGLPHMTFHDLRHVSASVMAELNIPDKYAQERGGWKTDQVMKKTYQHTFSAARKDVDNKIDSYFETIMQHEMQHGKAKTPEKSRVLLVENRGIEPLTS